MTDRPLQLGAQTQWPTSPEDAVLDRVPNPHADTDYVARFTCPEFTSLCPVTGQPDFAHLVIDYVPDQHLVESKSLKLYLAAFATTGRSMRTAPWPSASAWWGCWRRASSVSPAIGIRGAASPSMFSGRREPCRPARGYRTRASRRIVDAGERPRAGV